MTLFSRQSDDRTRGRFWRQDIAHKVADAINHEEADEYCCDEDTIAILFEGNKVHIGLAEVLMQQAENGVITSVDRLRVDDTTGRVQCRWFEEVYLNPPSNQRRKWVDGELAFITPVVPAEGLRNQWSVESCLFKVTMNYREDQKCFHP